MHYHQYKLQVNKIEEIKQRLVKFLVHMSENMQILCLQVFTG